MRGVAIGYYMRYIVTDERKVSLATLEKALKRIDPKYSLSDIHQELIEHGLLKHGKDLLGEIEIDNDPDGEELEELKEDVEESEGKNKLTVLQVLRKARTLVVVRVLWQKRTPEKTLSTLDPLWDWLLAKRKGLLQADGTGYYDRSGLILAVV